MTSPPKDKATANNDFLFRGSNLTGTSQNSYLFYKVS